MPIRCECGQCRTEFWAPENRAGKKIGCPVCRKTVLVPLAGGAVQPVVPVRSAAPPPSVQPVGSIPTVAPIPQSIQAAPVQLTPVQPTPAKTPSLLDAIEEELGPSAAVSRGNAGTGAADPWARRRGSRSRSTIQLSPRAAILVAVAGALAVYTMILLTLPKLALLLTYLILLGGMGIVFSGMCWHLYIALRESTSCMAWAVAVPFYAFYHLVTRWDKTRKPFRVMLLGWVVCAGSVAAIVYTQYRLDQRAATTASRPERPKAGSKFRIPSTPSTSPAPAPASESSQAEAKSPAAKPKAAPAAEPKEVDYEPATDLLTPPPDADKKK